MSEPQRAASDAAKPTHELFGAYRGMFEHFNQTLFGGELPEVVLNFSRAARSYGFFAPNRWERAAGEGKTHEISINPDWLVRDPRDVASTFVHELVHLWQEVYGTPPRRAYHDRQWAAKMETVGLVPSSTGQPGGKRLGQHMSHYIAEGGPFDLAFKAMPAACLLPWRTRSLLSAVVRPRGGSSTDASGKGTDSSEPAEPTARTRDASKLKYTCGCANVWGKPGLSISCNSCGRPFACSA